MGGDEYSWSIPVDDTVDPGPRTNQRAELLAAIEGLKKLHECNERHKKSAMRHKDKDDDRLYIVVTDSEYVVKGITEWFPTWRVRLSFSLVSLPQLILFLGKGLAYFRWQTT